MNNDLTSEQKAIEIMDKNNKQGSENIKAMQKHLNGMAESLSKVLEMMNALRLTNIRLSERIGKVESKAIILPGQTKNTGSFGSGSFGSGKFGNGPLN